MSGRLKIIDLLEADRRAVLFLDETNTTCSQMADGFAAYLSPSSMQVYSAGLHLPSGSSSVERLTVTVMKESGIDISAARPKGLDAIDLNQIAVAIALIEVDVRPDLPEHIKFLPIPLPNPANRHGSDHDMLETYRTSRNQVRELVSTLL